MPGIPLSPWPDPPPDSPCFICRTCQSILGWNRHVLFREIFAVIPDAFILSEVEPGSLTVDQMPFTRGLHSLLTLFCSRCGYLIGWKVATAAGPLAPIFPEGNYIFFARGILYWNCLDVEDPVWSPLDIH